MPNYPTPRLNGHVADDGARDADEPMIGYEAALPYLLSGHGGSGSDGWPHDAPLSCGVARGSPMGAAGQDF